MAIIFIDEVIGVDSGTSRNISQYFSKAYNGIVQYLERLDSTIKKVALIHYTNNSPSNNYGETLIQDTPVLELPTVMWHRNTTGQQGLTITTDFASRDILPDLNTEFYNLVDETGFVVGKVFNDLKIFVIEDQDLLFAMSYKANRNWTLPQIGAQINILACPSCDLAITSQLQNPTTIGGSNGQIIVNAINAVGSLTYSINGGTPQSSNVFGGLSAGSYIISAFDSGSPECVANDSVVLSDPTSTLSIEITNIIP
jgi:hypothetical protein